MSSTLISRSPDLAQLQSDGFEIEEVAGHVVIRNVPYVNSNRQVKRGAIVAVLNLNGDIAGQPPDHTILFSGEYPCDRHGRELPHIHDKNARQITKDLAVTCGFSSKPSEPDKNYHVKLTRYVNLISSHAAALDKNADARTWRVVENTDPDSPFQYIDNASSKAGITNVTRKLELSQIAIIGVGGTGSYVLDLVAKTPCKKIHLFDGDKLGQHNAFRSPGAASLEELKKIPYKVDYFASIYSRMHRGIVPHREHITAENVGQLRGMDHVFLCADAGTAKGQIIQKLVEFDLTFIDTGMGLQLVDDQLIGVLSVTTSTKDKRDHVPTRIPIAGDGNENIYADNIQIADLNAFSAALAVMKWKKLCGFYADFVHEHHSAYTIDGNSLVSGDRT
ncbi:MAG: ThiF family adenylyltransferase [Hyphomicrobiales bacterium]|nr:ThiF family adenylyltransferase [Hyphomicrobiales bacterium]